MVGSSELFVDPNAHPISGGRPLGVGKEKLGARVTKVLERCCYHFEGRKIRVLINSVTNQRYVPSQNGGTDVQVDYGVIRRFFRGSQNTLILEGAHRLGTLGATKVATDPWYLDLIWSALHEIDDFDETLPIEILVRSIYKPQQSQHIYALENITLEPLAIVYDRRWVYDLVEGKGWTDQLPWDVRLRMSDEEPPAHMDEADDDPPIPRLEVEVDLRGSIRSCARRAWTCSRAGTAVPRRRWAATTCSTSWSG